jgi:2-keto-4-pentenoate hydratase/2-oxohepta-3-ene-1,7-dioic acid hydratase in catechol pathway
MQHFTFELKINDTLVQQGNTDFMLYKPSQILQEISDFMRLEDGDIIMTGTPSGVGEVLSGSLFTLRLYANDQLLFEQQWRAN